MCPLPLLPVLAALVASLATGCGGVEEDRPQPDPEDAGEEIATIPFAERGLARDDFLLVSGAGDTMRFTTVAGDGPRIRLVRTLRTPSGTDSIAALIDARTKEPVASYQRRFADDGDVIVAHVSYGTGFEGQARLRLTTPRGSGSENLRTPSPVLDAAQLPQTFSALDFSRPDTISFNYVAPFEKRALAARVEIGGLDTLRIDDGAIPAHRITIRVSGLVERAWFAAPPGGFRLLRYEESTRGVTWSRPSAPE
ncbi:MAG: hypothetical protein KY397_00300 [Gemmatimonadetes bacterium]|nr:hypothetical protein [Gemmatimonadota bacterium]